MKRSLLCWLLGHKWRRKTHLVSSNDDYNFYGIAEDKACTRCGTPNPNYEG